MSMLHSFSLALRRMFHRSSATPVAVCLVLLLASSTVAANKPNVLLIVSDDQRPDTIAALGNQIISTPGLDRLVRSGTVFTRATCANPICTPSRAELLTGCTGMRNGVFDFGRTIDPVLPTLPKPFAAAGYATWYCGKWHNNGRPAVHGYAQTHRLFTGGGGKWWQPQSDYRGHPVTGYRGWIFRDADDQPLPDLGVGLTPNISATIADAAIDIIRQAGETPFLIHLNFTAPHDPLLLPPGFETRYDPKKIPLPQNFAPDHPFDHGNRGGRDEVLLPIPRTEALVRADIAAYYAVISHMDAQIGRILAALDQAGKTDETIVVFCSDHGLAMGSHGLRGKQNMYEHTIGVPLIFAGPSIPKGAVVTGQAYLRDIFPTLCELAGLAVPEVDGKSQVSVIQGKAATVYEYVIGYFRDSQRMIRTDRWKLIEYPQAKRVQLFDLVNDPYERDNRVADPRQAERVSQLKQQLADFLKQASAEQ
jgi:arylsulfatase A-like enzyme